MSRFKRRSCNNSVQVTENFFLNLYRFWSTLIALFMTIIAFVASVNQDQAAQNVKPGL